MIRKILIGAIMATLSVCLILPMSSASVINVFATEVDNGIETYDLYRWYYKEVDGVKYMRLWDTLNGCWVTDWFPVPEQ